MIDTGQIITIVLMLIGFGGQTLYFRGVFTTKLTEHDKEIKNLRESVRYKDTCEAISEGLESRISRLELTSNGRK